MRHCTWNGYIGMSLLRCIKREPRLQPAAQVMSACRLSRVSEGGLTVVRALAVWCTVSAMVFAQTEDNGRRGDAIGWPAQTPKASRVSGQHDQPFPVISPQVLIPNRSEGDRDSDRKAEALIVQPPVCSGAIYCRPVQKAANDRSPFRTASQNSLSFNGRILPALKPLHSMRNVAQSRELGSGPLIVPSVPEPVEAHGEPQQGSSQQPAVPLMQPAVPLISEPATGSVVRGVPVPRQHVRYGGHTAYHPGRSRFRASNECDAQPWMNPYRLRAGEATSNAMDAVVQPAPAMDPRFSAWWDGPVRSSTGMAPTALAINLDDLVQKAMLYSPQILAIKTEPIVQHYIVGQEEAQFDWSAFLETTWDDLKDPVGNELALGIPGEDRLSDQNFSTAFGMRRRNRHGGEFEVSQRAGHQRQNSRFFTPNPQGSSRLELRYRQPLLNGAGAVVNESQILLARITANASEDRVVGGLQDHLLQVTEAYWTLYRARAEFFQRQKLLQSSESVLKQLAGRNEVDTIPRQILRARAAVARAQAGIQRTLSRVRDAEAQLRLLVNAPELLNTGKVELTPQACPTMVTDTTEIRSSLELALQNRPDISEAIRQMRSSGVRMGVSRNELLPRLDFIVSSYVSDITGSSLSDTLYGQFTDVRPSYTLGMELEVPLGNRAARAKMEQRKWELKRSINVFRATVEKALTDVEIAHREVATAWSEVLSRYHAMTAAQNEASYLQDRFDVLPMAEDSATLLLEDLLDAFERVADEEGAFVQAQVAHAIAIIRLREEIGVLLRTRESRPQLDSTQARWLAERVESSGGETADHGLAKVPESPVPPAPVAESASLPSARGH